MQINQLRALVIDALEEGKAKDIEILDIRKLTDIADYMVVCTATSNRHSRSVAERVAVSAKANGVIPLSVEGNDTGEWVLIDLVDIIVHVMLKETREFYSLEKLWSIAEITRKPSVSKVAKTDKKISKSDKPKTVRTGKKIAISKPDKKTMAL